jgi:hypothetical protein
MQCRPGHHLSIWSTNSRLVHVAHTTGVHKTLRLRRRTQYALVTRKLLRRLLREGLQRPTTCRAKLAEVCTDQCHAPGRDLPRDDYFASLSAACESSPAADMHHASSGWFLRVMPLSVQSRGRCDEFLQDPAKGKKSTPDSLFQLVTRRPVQLIVRCSEAGCSVVFSPHKTDNVITQI